MTPFKEVPVFFCSLFLLSELFPSLGQNSSLPVPVCLGCCRARERKMGKGFWKFTQIPSMGFAMSACLVHLKPSEHLMKSQALSMGQE